MTESDPRQSLGTPKGAPTETPVPVPTRLQQALLCRPAGVSLSFAGAGVEFADERIGVVLEPTASGTLRAGVTGYPALTGLDEPQALLDAATSHEFAPGDLAVEGTQLRALARASLAPELRQGFELALAPALAQLLMHWLPRLTQVAERAARLAAAVHVQIALPPAAEPALGSALCAEVAAAVLLDGLAPRAALEAARREHWASDVQAWLDAIESPRVLGLLEASA